MRITSKKPSPAEIEDHKRAGDEEKAAHLQEVKVDYKYNEDLELKLIGYVTKMLQFKTRKEFRRNLEPIDIANNAKNVIKIISDTYESNNNTKKLENAK